MWFAFRKFTGIRALGGTIPGTVPFDGELVERGSALSAMRHTFNLAGNRAASAADEEGYCRTCGLNRRYVARTKRLFARIVDGEQCQFRAVLDAQLLVHRVEVHLHGPFADA